MSEMIKLIPLKYNQCHVEPPYSAVTDVGEVVLNGSDNAVLLVIEADDDMFLHIQPGNTVFAGGPKTLDLSESDTHYVYLECGPYVIHNSDGTDSIKFEVENGTCSMLALQLN